MLRKTRRISPAKQQRYALVFAALGDKTRLNLVAKLTSGKPRSISELTEGSDMTRQAITKHLQVLESAGIVESIRERRESMFELNPKPIEDITEYLSLISNQWDEALAGLKSFVED